MNDELKVNSELKSPFWKNVKKAETRTGNKAKKTPFGFKFWFTIGIVFSAFFAIYIGSSSINFINTLFNNPLVMVAIGAALGAIFVWRPLKKQSHRSSVQTPEDFLSKAKKPGTLAVLFGHLRARGALGGAMLFAFFLSVASFLTTAEGMISFTNASDTFEGELPAAHAIAFFVSFGVQGVLFLISFVISNDLATRAQKRTALKQADDLTTEEEKELKRLSRIYPLAKPFQVSILLLSMGVSVFFSFDSLFERVFTYKERQRVLVSVARSETTNALSSMKTGIDEEINNNIDSLASSGKWFSYETNLEAVLNMAASAEDVIAESLRGQIDELTAASDQSKKKFEDAIAQLETLNAQLIAAQEGGNVDRSTDIARLQADLDAANRRLTVADEEIEFLQGEFIIETEVGRIDPQTGQRSVPGVGPIARKLQSDIEIKQAERRPLITRRDSLQNQLEELIASQADGNARVETLQGRFDVLEREVAVLKQRSNSDLAALNLIVQNGSGNSNGDSVLGATPDSIIAKVRKAKVNFNQNGAPLAFSEMTTGCLQLLNQLQTNAAQIPGVGELTCAADEIAQEANRLKDLHTALKLFAASSEEPPAFLPSSTSNNINTSSSTSPKLACYVTKEFNEIVLTTEYVSLARQCLSLSGLPLEKEAPIRSKLDEVAITVSPDANHFTRNVSSLLRGDTLAWVALILAIVIDSVVLLAAITGELVQSGRESGPKTPKGDDAIDTGFKYFDTIRVRTRKVLISHVKDRINADNKEERFIDLRTITHGHLRNNVRLILQNYSANPQEKPKLIGNDVYAIPPSLYANELSLLKEDLKILENIPGHQSGSNSLYDSPYFDETTDEYHGYDKDIEVVSEDYETEFFTKENKGDESVEQNPDKSEDEPKSKSKSNDNAKNDGTDEGNTVRMPPKFNLPSGTQSRKK